MSSIPNYAVNSLSTGPKLTESNFYDWKEHVVRFLSSFGGKYIVDKVTAVPADKEEVDMQFGFILFERISPELQHLLKGINSGLEAWKKVSTYFQKSTFPRRVKAREEFYHVKHDPSQPIHVYISAVESAAQVLKDLGQEISATEILDLLMVNLDPSFHPIRTSLYASEKEPTLDVVKSILQSSATSLLDVKSEPMDSSSTFALATRQVYRPPGARPRSPSFEPGPVVDGYRWCDTSQDGRCHRCGRPRHVAIKCVYDMPQVVKDWVFSRDPGQYAQYVQSDQVVESSHFAASVSLDHPIPLHDPRLNPLLT